MADNGGVHRLSNMQVEEVSLVDRAANKRRFLVKKRADEGDMSLVSNGRGGLTRVSKAAGGKKPFPGAAKPFGEMDDDEKKKAKKALDEAIAQAGEMIKAMGESSQDGDDEESEKARKTAEIAARKAAGTSDGDDDGDEDEMKRSKKALADFLAKASSFFANDEEKRKKAASASSAVTSALPEVTKRGAKMSRARLEMFTKAIGDLQSLLSELMDSPAKDKDHAPQPGDPQMRQPNAVKSAEVQELVKSFDALASKVTGLERENAELRKSIPGGNSTPIDKGAGAGASAGDGAVEWPLDMNSESLDRSKIGKSESFFDV
jgi:hypothetical protein